MKDDTLIKITPHMGMTIGSTVMILEISPS